MACRAQTTSSTHRNPRARIEYAVLPLAARRRAILEQLEPIERAYAEMHPEDPNEGETSELINSLYSEVETAEAQMAAQTARSVDGLIEQMEVLKAHIAIDAPERVPLAEAVLRGLRRLKQGSRVRPPKTRI